MTVEEVQAKLAETETLLTQEVEKNKKLEGNQSNQNAYITKLEETKTSLQSSLDAIKIAADKPSLDPAITTYFKKKYTEDFANEGKANIRSNVGEDIFNILEPELNAFLKTSMTETNASIKFVIDAFNLLLGRAYSNPEHAIHKLEEGASSTQAQPQPEAQVVKTPFPTTMTNEDRGAGTPVPQKSVAAKDTKQAFTLFEDKLRNLGSNKFE